MHIYMHFNIGADVYTYECTHTYIYIHTHVYTHIYIYIYTCIYIYIHAHTLVCRRATYPEPGGGPEVAEERLGTPSEVDEAAFWSKLGEPSSKLLLRGRYWGPKGSSLKGYKTLYYEC